jgi:hypothetical protein
MPKFMQITMPLLPLKLMAQLWLGARKALEARLHPLVMVIPKFMQITMKGTISGINLDIAITSRRPFASIVFIPPSCD